MNESIYERLGIKRIINGSSWVTSVGGSIMPPEVVQAMADSVNAFVDMRELNCKAGEVIAEATGAEAGLVTAGASAGLVLQVAACMTGMDEAKAARLPSAQPRMICACSAGNSWTPRSASCTRASAASN